VATGISMLVVTLIK